MVKAKRKDPAFLFYPGDYLRDTQCLSEKAQVAYDRIMCEHMRNICSDVSNIAITQERLNFFTKRLSEDEKSELMHVLVRAGDKFQIEWVAISIYERSVYSESRSKNRRKKEKEDVKSYESHMEDAIENTVVFKEGEEKTKFNQKPVASEFNGLPSPRIKTIIETIGVMKYVKIDAEKVTRMWEVFKTQFLVGVKFYQNESAVYEHFFNWIKKQDFKEEKKPLPQNISMAIPQVTEDDLKKYR